MKLQKAFVCLFTAFLCSSLCTFAMSNELIRQQMYSAVKSKPYFSTQKSFIDKFISELNQMGFNADKAHWRAIDKQIVVDETSFKEMDNVYFLVYKTLDNNIIGLVKFKCKTKDNGGFKKIESYNYKKYNGFVDVNVNRFNFIEESVCEG